MIDGNMTEENGPGGDAIVQVSDQIEEQSLYKCVICCTALTKAKQPKLLECLHAACAACIATTIEDQADVELITNGMKCPKCDVFCNQQHMIDNHFVVENESENESDIKCVSCEDNAPATSYCVECKDFICASCVEAHRRVKITKDHTLKEKDEAEAEVLASATNRTVACSIHPNEQCTLFCETCDKMTCRDCQLNEHRDHKYKFVHEIAGTTRSYISTLLNDVSYKRVLLKSAMKVIDDRQQSIADKKTALSSEVSQVCVDIIEAVKAKLKSIVERLTETCDNKHQALIEKKKTLEKLSNMTDHCISFVTDALGKGSDLALLYSKKTITSHLQRIKARRADIPNPEIPVRISVAYRLQELLNSVSNLATVSVDNRVVEDGNRLPNLDQVSPPPISFPHHPPNYSQQNQYATANGNGRTSHANATPPPASKTRAPHVNQYQQNHTTHSSRNVVPHSPIYGMSSMIMGVTSPYNNASMQMPHVTIRPTNPSQQVSSSTHPSGEINLRSLLPNPNTGFQQLMPGYNQIYRPLAPKRQASSPHNVTSQIQHNYQQQVRNAMRNQKAPPPYPSQVLTHKSVPGALWHSPQQQGSTSTTRPPPNALPIDESFKIHLKTQNNTDNRPSVTSSVPKTPSPGTSKDDVQTQIDKYVQDSVNELRVTIAKLDSNGIEVIPEFGDRLNPESQVDSSTENNNNNKTVKTSENHKDDANEDWCAVCMDGGELICCDNCPKVFHINCHIPVLDGVSEETEGWQCLLCSDVANLIPPEEEAGKRKHGLSYQSWKIAERILLELYCQYECSQPFRQAPTDPIVLAKMPQLITLETIKHRLAAKSYTSLKDFVLDVRRLFKYAKIAYHRDHSDVQNAKQLEKFFERVLNRWVPNAIEYIDMESDDEVVIEAKKLKRDE